MGSFFKIVRTIEATGLFTLNLASKKPLDTLPAKQENLASISPTYWEERKKTILLLASLALTISSFTAQANAEPTKSDKVEVKKYSVGKPGYNRHVAKEHTKNIHANAEFTKSEKAEVKKYSVGKPGHNRHIVKK